MTVWHSPGCYALRADESPGFQVSRRTIGACRYLVDSFAQMFPEAVEFPVRVKGLFRRITWVSVIS
jgi:hypothetical protein